MMLSLVILGVVFRKFIDNWELDVAAAFASWAVVYSYKGCQ